MLDAKKMLNDLMGYEDDDEEADDPFLGEMIDKVFEEYARLNAENPNKDYQVEVVRGADGELTVISTPIK